MTQTTATIGAGTLLVFQPTTGTDEIALPVALGIQRFWSRQLKEVGRPAAYFVAVVQLERLRDAQGADVSSDNVAVGDKFVMPLAGFGDDAEVARIVVSNGARWGLYSSFALMGPRFRLQARLVETDGGGLRVLDEREIKDDNLELPRILVESWRQRLSILACVPRGSTGQCPSQQRTNTPPCTTSRPRGPARWSRKELASASPTRSSRSWRLSPRLPR